MAHIFFVRVFWTFSFVGCHFPCAPPNFLPFFGAGFFTRLLWRDTLFFFPQHRLSPRRFRCDFGFHPLCSPLPKRRRSDESVNDGRLFLSITPHRVPPPRLENLLT